MRYAPAAPRADLFGRPRGKLDVAFQVCVVDPEGDYANSRLATEGWTTRRGCTT